MRRFLTPTMLGAHLLALVATGSAGWLGYWQYDAWQDRRAAESIDLTRLDAKPLADVMGPDDRFPGDQLGRPVVVAGTWVPEGTVFVSGREHEGADGYWLVTPLAVEDADDPALPIVRGWTPSVGDAPPDPTGTTRLVAWLQPTQGTGEPDEDPTDEVLPQVRTADLIQHVDQDLYGAYAVAQEPEAGLEAATLAQLPEVGRFTALRNLLYAVEWLFFGAFAAFIWWRYVNEREPDHESQQGSGGGSDGDSDGGSADPAEDPPGQRGAGSALVGPRVDP